MHRRPFAWVVLWSMCAHSGYHFQPVASLTSENIYKAPISRGILISSEAAYCICCLNIASDPRICSSGITKPEVSELVFWSRVLSIARDCLTCFQINPACHQPRFFVKESDHNSHFMSNFTSKPTPRNARDSDGSDSWYMCNIL